MALIGMSRITAFAIALLLGWQIYQAILHFRQPYSYDYVYAEPPAVTQGQPLSIIYAFTRLRVCETNLVRFILDRSDSSVITRVSVSGGATLAGHHIVRNEIKESANLPPGNYVLRTMSFSDCVDGKHAVVAPDINFEVRPAQP